MHFRGPTPAPATARCVRDQTNAGTGTSTCTQMRVCLPAAVAVAFEALAVMTRSSGNTGDAFAAGGIGIDDMHQQRAAVVMSLQLEALVWVTRISSVLRW